MNKKQSTLYKNLLINYSIATLVFILILNFIFIFFISNFLHNDINFKKKTMLNQIEKEISSFEEVSSFFINSICQNQFFLEQATFLLNNSYSTYTKYKLDTFSATSFPYYFWLEDFIQEVLQNNTIKSINFISYIDKTNIAFYPNNKIYTKTLSESDIKNIQDLNNISYKEDDFIYIAPIKDQNTLYLQGFILLEFDFDLIHTIYEQYSPFLTLSIADFNTNDILYTTAEDINIDTNNNFNILKLNSDIFLYTAANTLSIIKDNYLYLIYIILFNILFFIILEVFIIKKISKITFRLNNIIDYMQNIDKGKTAKIPIQAENDEITTISKTFNDICDKLEDSIKKQYIAEINQKNAEMNALQNSINPHFLYNTLEAIRMKAVINKDKEIGKMIYLLAYLYRKQLKEKEIITIKSEIDYCEKFLQIHEFRYQGQFSYSIHCEEILLNKKTIKFILQPLIENYFIHGIRLENDDNQVTIAIKLVEEKIKITIQDNGLGIDKERLQNVLNNIKKEQNDTHNFGIYNVNKRIITKYGNEYGVFIESELNKGTTIIVTLPYV